MESPAHFFFLYIQDTDRPPSSEGGDRRRILARSTARPARGAVGSRRFPSHL
jgi:hypothetical protein